MSWGYEADRLRALEEAIDKLPKDPAALAKLVEQRHLLELLAWDNCPEWVALTRSLASETPYRCPALHGQWTPGRCVTLGIASEIDALCALLNSLPEAPK